MSHRKIVFIGLIIVALAIGLFGAVSLSKVPKVVSPAGNQVACTMEAMLCPDGSYVGRHGPKCEFDRCPVATAIATSTYKGKAVAIFEGTWELPYELIYDSSRISVSTTSINNEITIKDVTSTSEAKFYFSYEGGRGYSPEDYWRDILSKVCSNCTQVSAPFTNIFLPSPLMYTNGAMTYAVSAIYAPSVTTEPWLAVITYPKNVPVSSILASFRVVKK